MLADAVKNGTLARNVAAVHAPPEVEDDELEILPPEQTADVLAKLDGHTLFPSSHSRSQPGCDGANCLGSGGAT
jgi:hypothetical protein